MDIQSIIGELGSVANLLNVIVIGTGYYFLIRLYREWIRQSRNARVAGGRRPMLIVTADYTHLPRVDLVVQNFISAPAKEISFNFSSPIADSSGFVLSDLPFFKEGLPFLEPEAQITHYWDHLPNLVPILKEKGLEDGIKVSTSYKDLAGESYETEWTIHPLLFEGDYRVQRLEGMNDLVNVVRGISEGSVGRMDARRKRSRTTEEARASYGERSD